MIKIPPDPRPVAVQLRGDVYVVVYLDGSKRRHFAASFYAPDTTETAVRTWVEKNPKLWLTN